MRYPLYIAKRYLFSKSNRNAVNIISKVAVGAVILGAAALFIVLSGFAGLKDFAIEFTNVFDSDLKVHPAQGKTFQVSPEKFQEILDLKGVQSVSRAIEERVFVQYEGRHHICFLKGVDANYPKVTPVDSILFLGEWFQPGQNEVVMGFGISSKLSVPVRDYGKWMELYVPKPGTGQINELDPSSAFNSEKVVASGIYEINEDLNSKYLFSDLEFAEKLLGLDANQVSSLEVKLAPEANESEVSNSISSLLNQNVIIKNRVQQNDALYKMLNSENLFTYLFVSLIAAIAIFNIAGTVIMIILEKRNNIKTLYFMGMTIREIRKVFFYNGMLMTFLGVLIGLVLGSLIVWLQMNFGWVRITETLAYPVQFKMVNLLVVFGTILLLGGIASTTASLRVSERLLS